MSAAPSTNEAAALRLADLRADAALHGESIPAALRRRVGREAAAAGNCPAARAWRAMALPTREALVTLCTNPRDLTAAAVQPWSAFSAAEQIAIGGTARQWRRDMMHAGWLR